MKKHLFLCTAALLISVAASAGGKIVTDSLHSAILGADVKYNVYLPESFSKSDKQYPVVYLLHGLSGNYTDWAKRANTKMIADEFIESGEAKEMVIIMPNAGGQPTDKVWNGYFNMKGWNYEDFFFKEFLPAVEAKYRCIGDKGHRAVMGLSMGGGGSTVYCQRHPDMFSSCFAMSPWLDQKNDEVSVSHTEDNKLYVVGMSVREHSALDFIENADEKTVEKLRTVAWFFDCGDDDFLVELSMNIHVMMSKKGIKNELRIRNGIHNWEYWHESLRMALPFASRNFD